jgi:hypothetical protein
MDAELIIVEAFVREQARYDRIRQLEADKRSPAVPV